jgi:hypothetical protein
MEIAVVRRCQNWRKSCTTVSEITMMSENTSPRLWCIIFSKIHHWNLHVRFFYLGRTQLIPKRVCNLKQFWPMIEKIIMTKVQWGFSEIGSLKEAALSLWLIHLNITPVKNSKNISAHQAESFGWFIEGQAFSPSHDSAPRPQHFPPHLPSVGSTGNTLEYWERETTRWRESGQCRGWARSRIIRPQESLVLFKSFNTLWHQNWKTFPLRRGPLVPS